MNDNNKIGFYGPRGIVYFVPAEIDDNGELKIVEQDSECGKMMWRMVRNIIVENEKLRDEIWNLKFPDDKRPNSNKWYEFWK